MQPKYRSSNKKLAVRPWSLQVLSDNLDDVIIWHLSHSVGAALKELFCI
jgi:hypothetical protein